MDWRRYLVGNSDFVGSSSNAPTEFTIHGLWPDYNDGTWPACCTRSSFDRKEVLVLLCTEICMSFLLLKFVWFSRAESDLHNGQLLLI
ncbi:Ribonuclease 2 [Vitis vinifera]|uniref:Ribonuclease 2 n=1 Tax=Vitis vinifera TaxID=29760 RepID=A0A438KQ85_VITVI|nr:Ribonuclease 2 [Vitis vinifera]